MSMMVDQHPKLPSESPSSPAGAADRRLLLLAAVSQRAEEQESSAAVVAPKGSPCTSSNVHSAAAADSKIIATNDGAKINEEAVATIPPKKNRLLSEPVTAETTRSVDPITFTVNADEDIMTQLHRNGLDQVKIPPLYSEPLSPTQRKKRKVSEGTLDAAACCRGYLDAPLETVMPSSYGDRTQANNSRGLLPKIVTNGSSPNSTQKRQMVAAPSMSNVPPPPLGTNNMDCGTAASLPKRNEYHEQIMSVLMRDLTDSNLKLFMQSCPQGRRNDMSSPSTLPCSQVGLEDRSNNPLLQAHEQQRNVLPTDDQGPLKIPKKVIAPWSTSSTAGFSAPNSNLMFQNMQHELQKQQQMIMMMQQRLMAADEEGPLKKKQNNAPSRRVMSELQGENKTDGKSVVFPNQELYSQMLRKKESASRLKTLNSLSTEALVASIARREDEAEMARRAATQIKIDAQIKIEEAAAAWKPPLSVHESEVVGPAQKALQIERALAYKEKKKQLQKYMRQQRQALDVRKKGKPNKALKQQQQQQLQAALTARHIMQQDPRCLPLANPQQVRLSLLDLENQVRAEEEARILQTNQRQMSELQQQAVHLEEQLKLREMEFMRERNRLVDMQTVNRLRLQADELEKRLMM